MIDDSNMMPDNFDGMSEDEQARIALGILQREHEQYAKEWAALSEDERRRQRMKHFRD